ncbi:MAG: hypothetical protein DRI33_03890 [Caldiserica bacterium]|nr:MAG: hypothetical protein DRI33_03890 [Caldisericota bacterium]
MKVNKKITASIISLRNISFLSEALRNNIFLFLLIILSTLTSVNAQDDKEKQKGLKQSQELLSEASYEMKNDNFPLAEAEYREAISLNPKAATGKYNLGTAYYNKEMNAIAMNRFKQAASVADKKIDKHKAFHNLGNTYMNEKKYQEAVEAYKNALRNNTKDEETRYNLALAKELLEDQQKDGGGDDENEDQEDKKDQDKEQENENNKKDGEDGDEEKEDEKGEEKEDKKEGDEKADKGKPDEPKDEKENKQPPPPVPGQLSPQQVKNLLEAMNNEEKKVQDKINAKKQKGAKVKSEKDW